MFNTEVKKKISIDFSPANHEKLVKFVENYPGITSSSAAINYLVTVFADLPTQIRDTLAKACHDAIKEEEALFSGRGSFEKEEATRRMGLYREIILFVTQQQGYTTREKIMNKIEIKNGHAIIPEDWIVVKNINPLSCEHVGVIEVRNGEKYNAPHIVFFSYKPINQLSDAERDDIIEKCICHYPKLGKLKAMQIEPVFDKDRNIINAEQYMAAPAIGLFAIPIYGTMTAFPEGAMIVRE